MILKMNKPILDWLIFESFLYSFFNSLFDDLFSDSLFDNANKDIL